MVVLLSGLRACGACGWMASGGCVIRQDNAALGVAVWRLNVALRVGLLVPSCQAVKDQRERELRDSIEQPRSF